MNKSRILHDLGQSIWFDNVDRALIENGWFQEQIKTQKFFGVTSNPSIFKKSITAGTVYSLDIQTMSWAGLDSGAIYENLAVHDIRTVADLLAPIYEQTNKADGYVSLEVDPTLANDAKRTVKEAKRLWNLVNRNNLMIKIPATIAGISAITEVITAGINVNVTLIFSPERYEAVMDAYYSGLEKRISEKLFIGDIHSVASIFVSRFDVMLDAKIEALKTTGKIDKDFPDKVQGKAALLNSLFSYELFKAFHESQRYQKIEEMGGNIQRPLWASTSTKNPDYDDLLYVEGLILPQTVNTIPPKTLDAFLDHGSPEVVEPVDIRTRWEAMKSGLDNQGIDVEEIYVALEEEGVQKFADAQEALMRAIEKERIHYLSDIQEIKAMVNSQVKELKDQDFIRRFFHPDASLFTSVKEEEDEVLHRMGWLAAPETSLPLVELADNLRSNLLSEGFTHAVVLGMGGSSLAPEVFSEVFKDEISPKKGLVLSILDSTDPGQILFKKDSLHLQKTLFIASSKSGTTVEMKSLVAYFMEELRQLNVKDIGSHFIAITDPGTKLESFAKENNFRKIINADPNVGGRYSALIAFGIVPAVLMGIDGKRLLERANVMRGKCDAESELETNPAIILGSVLAESYKNGLNKLTIFSDEAYLSVGSWLEQLIAESSGKNGKGLLPIDLEPIQQADTYTKDRIFYYLRNDGKHDGLIEALRNAGAVVISADISDPYAIGAEMYKWEFATAVFCSLIGVNPFNQPNVQTSKSLATKMIEDYKKTPTLDEGYIVSENDAVMVYSNLEEFLKDSLSPKEVVRKFLSIKSGEFIAVNAFLPRIPAYEKVLSEFRKKLSTKYQIPTTLGFGPRFLHSTGQLHKGGENNGRFIILTQTPQKDIEIPGEGIKFSVLEKAQALGDMQALEAHNRKVIHIHFKNKIDLNLLLSDQ